MTLETRLFEEDLTTEELQKLGKWNNSNQSRIERLETAVEDLQKHVKMLVEIVQEQTRGKPRRSKGA